MASYEDDHNIETSTAPPPRRPRARIDFDEFFSVFARNHPSPSFTTTGEDHTNDAAAFRALADALTGTAEGVVRNVIIEQLVRDAEAGEGAEGVPDGWTDTLERVPKARLGDGKCPICGEVFKDDPYPLVVRLPCHRDHIFDLECIAPWLKLKSTCPLDRKELVKKKVPPPLPPVEDEDEEWNQLYG